MRKLKSGSGDSTPPPDDQLPSAGGGPSSSERAPESEQRDVRHWQDRWKSADKVYQQWAKDFNVRKAEDFFEGRQWPEAFRTGDPMTEPYAINLIASTINVRIPSLFFYLPSVRVAARPWRSDDSQSKVEARAVLQENTVNGVIKDPRTNYQEETTHALLDAFFRFGVVMTGYDADFTYNPNAGKPPLEIEDYLAHQEKTTGRKLTSIPDRVPTKDTEYCYVRHIPAESFRVAMHTGHRLDAADWCGYAEWHYVSDLRDDKSLSRTSRLKPQGKLAGEMQGLEKDQDRERVGLDADLPSRRGMVRVLFIWDLRTKTRFMIPETQRFFLLKPQPYKVLPFSIVKLGRRVKGFYPFPPASMWLAPQAEYNDTRESLRLHRRRFHRRYKTQKNSVDPAEMAKLETGSDGTVIETIGPVESALLPSQDAPLDPAVTRNIGATLNDFAQVAVGGEGRGIAEADTATQANIVDARAQVKDNYSRQEVARWHADIARRLLLSLRHYMVWPFWVLRNTDLLSPGAPEEALQVKETYEQIANGEALGDISLDVAVDMESLSPINDITERQDWTQILGLLGNDNMLMLHAASDEMLKITLSRYGVKSGKQIEDIRTAMRVVLAAKGILQALEAGQVLSQQVDMQQGQGPQGPLGPRPLQPGSPQLAQGASPGPTPTNAATKLQLARQGQ
jgi:hypothetical protein